MFHQLDLNMDEYGGFFLECGDSWEIFQDSLNIFHQTMGDLAKDVALRCHIWKVSRWKLPPFAEEFSSSSFRLGIYHSKIWRLEDRWHRWSELLPRQWLARWSLAVGSSVCVVLGMQSWPPGWWIGWCMALGFTTLVRAIGKALWRAERSMAGFSFEVATWSVSDALWLSRSPFADSKA